MLIRNFVLSGLLAVTASATTTGSESSTSTSSKTDTKTGTDSTTTLTGSYSVSSFTGTYDTDTVQITVSQTSDGTATSSDSSTTTTTKGYTSEVTLLVGGGVGVETLSVINGTTTIYPNTTASATGTGTATSSSATPTNTQACNNYAEFCDRKYSNITEVCAHNSAFSVKGNAASNQDYPVTDQLDDGIRMIQGEVHYVNDTLYSCHTSCDLLNAGTWQSEMTTVADWVKTHPYDVVTILIVNSDYVEVGNFSEPLLEAGLGPYLYEPPKIPMHLDDWPTLSDLILTQKRVIVFMDYEANQTAVPYILDEFTHMFETPFSPQNRSFPCTIQRPPTLTNTTTAKDQYMYLANHNLNQDISFAGIDLLIPNTAEINITNADTNQYGTLGAMADNCTADWGRAPNFLLVDFYNDGNFQGSVFEVAAKHNGVTYNRKCCGDESSSASRARKSTAALLVAAVAAIAYSMF